MLILFFFIGSREFVLVKALYSSIGWCGVGGARGEGCYRCYWC